MRVANERTGERENRSQSKGCLNARFTMNCHLLILVCLGVSSAATTTRFDPFTFFAITSRLRDTADIWRPLDSQTIERLLSESPLPPRRDCDHLVPLYTSDNPNDVNNSSLYSLCQLASSCLESSDAEDILTSLTKGASPSVDTSTLQKCSLMLAGKDAAHCHKVQSKQVVKSSRQTSVSVWAIGFLSVTVINLTSVIGVVIVPFLNKSSYLSALNLFEGLAVGSLTGSAIFHLIPAAFNLITDNSNHDYLYKALMIFGGIYLFYWSEKFMSIYSAMRASSSKKSGNNAAANVVNHDTDNQLEAIENGDKNATVDFESRLRSASDSLARVHHGHSHEQSRTKGEIATVAWMIIFGDGLHNFIDGLSIGAAFNESILTGLSICVAVVCEEFPHELGDFAVLIASGMSVRQAVGYNFLSACTCYAGLFVGIWLGDMGPTYIFALAGGMFLYIALVDMMRELNSSVEEALTTSVSKTAKVLVLQNLGIVIGILTLFLLARYSENIRF